MSTRESREGGKDFAVANQPIMLISPYKTSCFFCINYCCKTKHPCVATNTAGQSVTVGGIFIGYLANQIANDLDFHENGRGVTLNNHWLPVPYYEVTSNYE